jgi:ATP-dependent RNA helicase RhlE
MGFLPDLKRIIAKLPAERQTLLFSATMPPEIEALCKSVLRTPTKVSVGIAGQAAHQVKQVVFPVPMHRKAALLQHLIEMWENPSVLVFTRTKHGAKRLAKILDRDGHHVAELHGDRTPNQRERAMQGFRDRKIPLLVATNIAARGLDVRHITHVVNYDLPEVPEEYVHRIGRTGRGGDTGEAISLVSPAENGMLARIERQIRQRISRVNLEDFDYGVPAEPKPKFQPVPVGAGVSGGNKRKEPKVKIVTFDRQKKKPSRGQGGR